MPEGCGVFVSCFCLWRFDVGVIGLSMVHILVCGCFVYTFSLKKQIWDFGKNNPRYTFLVLP